MLNSGHTEILKMFHFTFNLFIYIVYNHWHALSVDPHGFCFFLLRGIAGEGAVTLQVWFSNLKQTPKLCYFRDSYLNILHK